MKRFRLLRLVFTGLIAGIVGFPGMSFAEEGGVLEIGEVVVTATRVERPVGSLSASVTVITREEIEQSPAKTVDDLLRREAGILVRRERGLTGSTHVTMRGVGHTARVLILKDGVSLNKNFIGDGGWVFDPISIQDIERIEIVRGPASSLHGSSAMGGVINIITRRAEPDLSGNVSLEGGGLGNTAIGSFGLRYGAENFALRFAAEHKQGGGYEFMYPWGEDWVLAERELNHLSLGGDLQLGESLLKVDFDRFMSDTLGAAARTQSNLVSETSKYRVSWETPLWGWGEETAFSIEAHYFDNEWSNTLNRRNPETREFDVFSREFRRLDNHYGIMSQISTVLGSHHLVAGIDLSRGDGYHKVATAVIPKDRKFEGGRHLSALFINNEMHLGERIILNASLRYDRWENRGGRFYDRRLGRWQEFPEVMDSKISPGGGIVYALTGNTRLRTSFGTGFRAPSLLMMFISGPVGRRYILGNPDLKSERLAWSYDVGIEHHHENFDLSLTFYQSRVNNAFARETLEPGDPRIPAWVDTGERRVSMPFNIDEVDIHGFEAALNFRFNEKWSAFINHTYNISKVRKHGRWPALEGNYLTMSPRHNSVFGFTYDNPRLFTLSLSVESRDSRYSDMRNTRVRPGFQIVNMKASRELFEGLDVFINVENLTDEVWGDPPRRLSPPFNLLVGSRFTF